MTSAATYSAFGSGYTRIGPFFRKSPSSDHYDPLSAGRCPHLQHNQGSNFSSWLCLSRVSDSKRVKTKEPVNSLEKNSAGWGVRFPSGYPQDMKQSFFTRNSIKRGIAVEASLSSGSHSSSEPLDPFGPKSLGRPDLILDSSPCSASSNLQPEKSNLLKPWPEEDTSSRSPVAGIDQTNLKYPHEIVASGSKFAAFGGVDLHYREAHPFAELSKEEEETLGDGGTLILRSPSFLLHGFGASLFSWEKIMNPVASLTGSTAIAFDRPGFGFTARLRPPGDFSDLSKPASNPYSLQFSVCGTLAFVSKICTSPHEKAIIIGHSAGCLTAVQSYLESPQKIKALVLIAPAIVPPLLKKISGMQRSRSEKADNEEASNDDFLKRIFKWLTSAIYTAWAAIAFLIIQAFLSLLHVVKYIYSNGRLLLSKLHSVFMASSFAKRPDIIRTPWLVGSFILAVFSFIAAQFGLSIVWVAKKCGQTVQVIGMGWETSAMQIASTLLRNALILRLTRNIIDTVGVRVVKSSWHDPSKVDEHTIKGYTEPLKCRDWDRALVEYLIALSLNPNVGARLHEVDCPVLVLAGDNDSLVPAWNSERVAKAIPTSMYRVIPNCGHVPQEECPKQTLFQIRQFLTHYFAEGDTSAYSTNNYAMT